MRRYVLTLGARNRRVLAKRADDPPGSVEAAERLERQHPGISVSWFPANTCKEFERAAGFYGWWGDADPGWMSPTAGWVRRREWYGVTAEELGRKLP